MAHLNSIPLRFQVISLVCTAAIIVMLFVQEIKKPCMLDPKPAIFKILPATTKNFTAQPTKVQVGLTITDFPEFNVEENKFTFSGVVWFEFDPSLISLDTISRFSFLKGNIEFKSNPLTRLEGNKVIAEYQVRVVFKTNLYYGSFPFDDHIIYLALVNREVNPSEVLFKSSESDSILTEDLYVSGWTYGDKEVSSGFGSIPMGSRAFERKRDYPEILFGIHFFHESMRYIISIILPLLIVFFIDLFTFCLDQNLDHTVLVSVSTGNIISLIAYRFIIESMAPRVGYLLLSDYAFFLFLSNTFTVFIINCMGPYLQIRQKKIISLSLQAIIICSFIFLFNVWIPC